MPLIKQQDLVPDKKILSTIFSDAPGVTLTNCNIFLNTFDICTFSIHLDVAFFSSYFKNLLVRLKTSGNRLAVVAFFQRLKYA